MMCQVYVGTVHLDPSRSCERYLESRNRIRAVYLLSDLGSRLRKALLH